MNRREFITLVGGAAAVWPAVAKAQQSAKVHQLGFLTGGTKDSQRPRLAEFRRGLTELGFDEGQNLTIASRFADGRFDRLPALANELLSGNPDALFVSTPPAALAAK